MVEKVKWVNGRGPAGDQEHGMSVAALSLFNEEEVKETGNFIKSFPQYKVTPLVSLDNLAENLGVAGIHVKDESYRFGLNSFKVLGGGHAIGRYLGSQLGKNLNEISYSYLRSDQVKKRLGEITFTSATDGNHGRGVAWVAGQLGHRAVINMPAGSSPIRLEQIRATGAEGYITDVNYDETVRITAENASKNGWLMVQDTAWEGYEEIPNRVMQGYTVMAAEALGQLQEKGIERPSHLFIQAGVGSLAGAVLGYFFNKLKKNMPLSAVIEPNRADCFYRSALAGDGQPRHVSGKLDTIMAGLACGEPNPVAWDILWKLSAMYISCPDYIAANGMRILGNPLKNDHMVRSGESGAVTTGILSELVRKDYLHEARSFLKLGPDSQILLFSTEGDTDPEMYRKIVWDGLYPGL